ncbi:beta-N-acetylglucosaminidase domain-containing protein [Mycoplasmopsis lipofaciens]|uniref:beta-N-acetylglucosaminidase domain-containing protein n=1 Tax=Mycoplasmopsis lipofaciens TaxID=114884 RepID=UPI0006903008|nr:beta-N-acetylglucosaminidase domain-containing protein [Mycoplasmopsis lipofaciens]
MKKIVKNLITNLSGMSLLGSLTAIISASGATNSTPTNKYKEYEIFPNPHTVAYRDEDYLITSKINFIIEEGIDQATKARLQEIMNLKHLSYSESREIKRDMTNIIIGTKDNADNFVDNYFDNNIKNGVSTANLFEKTDSYVLDNNDNVITVYGRDNDSTFYGLTTLYHIFNQISRSIREFTIEDYADVKSRGFIEGYYGNPWSVEDRSKLMEWSGYYKLNSYFYAPKDDPKHNREWRTLYTQEELDRLIKPLAKAGNNSKCRFVFALHPFMHRPIRFDTESNYQNDLQILQAKFLQAIEVGVRQIAILADDARDVGGSNYVKLLTDMVAWIKEQKQTYPDLKETLAFCPTDYGGWGNNSSYKNYPPEVQILVTGGRVWGESSVNFTNSFTTNAGRAPYLWINWPCSDNSKSHLIMGGYDKFLHPSVNPNNLEGVVLNPMQQSEPSKVAIFGNADYTWNIWKSKDDADKAYNASFKHVDSKSSYDTLASLALKELSKHMINQKMDSRVVKLEESSILKEKLNTFREKLNNNTYQVEDIDLLINEFKILYKAQETYRNNPGDSRIRDQIIYWLDAWKDITSAANYFLESLKEFKIGNTIDAIENYNRGRNNLISSRNHKFHYVDHMERAEVGPQHITPFINFLGNFVGNLQQDVLDETRNRFTFISNSFINSTSGNPNDLFNLNSSTTVQWKRYKDGSNIIKNNDYFGVKFSKPIELKNIYIKQENGKNHLYHSKLQYTTDGTNWNDIPGKNYEMPRDQVREIDERDINISGVLGVRLISTADNGDDSWFTLNAFHINKDYTINTDDDTITISQINLVGNGSRSHHGSTSNLLDDNISTEYWISSDGSRTNNGAGFELILDQIKEVTSVYLSQGNSQHGDVINKGEVQYFDNNDNQWKKFGNLDNSLEQTVLNRVLTNKIRVINKENKRIWWRVGEIKVTGYNNEPVIGKAKGSNSHIPNHSSINDNAKNNNFRYITDGDETTYAWIAGGTSGQGNIRAGDGIVVNFNKVLELSHIKFVQADSGDKMSNLKFEVSLGGNNNWQEIKTVTGAGGVVEFDVPSTISYVDSLRVTSTSNARTWWKIKELSVIEKTRTSSKNVYTNKSSQELKATKSSSGFSFEPQNGIILNQDEYFGYDLGDILPVEKVELNSSSFSGLTIQYSDNSLVWNNVSSMDELADKSFRYLRIINKEADQKTIDISKFDLTIASNVAFGTLVNATIENNNGWGDTRENGAAFDSNMNTTIKFGGNPKKGDEFVFDLGKTININSLRIYSNDNHSDYLRDAKVLLSENGNIWTEAFVVGDSTTDSNREGTLVSLGLWNVDSNYPNVRYVGSDELNQNARYIKFEILANYPNRAIMFNEIVINNGEYISKETSNYFSGTIEEPNKLPSNMIDKDFNTTYKGSSANGHISYKIQDSQDLKVVKIIQYGDVSSAEVIAELFDESSNNVENIVLGKLSQTINSFDLPTNKKIISLKISWTNKIPEISEIVLSKVNHLPGDKNELENQISRTPDTDQWLDSYKTKYEKIKQYAEEVRDSQYISKESIDLITNALRIIIDNPKIKGNIAELSELVNTKKSNSDDYTTVTYSSYDVAIKNAEILLQDANNLTTEEIEEAKSLIISTQSNLVYSTQSREKAELKVREFNTLNSSILDSTLYSELQGIVNEIQNKANDDKIANSNDDRIIPSEFQNLVVAYNSKFSEIKNAKKTEYENAKESLNATINKYKNDYPTEVQALETLIAQKDQVVNSSNVTIDEIEEAKNILVEKNNSFKNNLVSSEKTLYESKKSEAEAYKDIIAASNSEDAQRIIDLINQKNQIVNESAVEPQEVKSATQALQELLNSIKENINNKKNEFALAKEQAIAYKESIKDTELQLAENLATLIAEQQAIVDQNYNPNNIEAAKQKINKALQDTRDAIDNKNTKKEEYENAKKSQNRTIYIAVGTTVAIIFVLGVTIFLYFKKKK